MNYPVLRRESLKHANHSAPRRGVLGPPCPTHLTICSGLPTSKAFTINLQRQYYHLSFFLLFSFFQSKETWIYRHTRHLNEIPRCINPTVCSWCRRSPISLLRGQFTSKPQERRRLLWVSAPPRPQGNKPAPGYTRREPAGTHMDDSSLWRHGPNVGRRGLAGRERETGIRLDAILCSPPYLRPRLKQDLETETAATAELRSVPGTAGRNRRRRARGQVGKSCSSLGFVPGCEMRPSGSLCALKSIYRQRNPRSAFLGIHSVVPLWVFLFRTTIVRKTGRSCRCNKIGIRN